MESPPLQRLTGAQRKEIRFAIRAAFMDADEEADEKLSERELLGRFESVTQALGCGWTEVLERLCTEDFVLEMRAPADSPMRGYWKGRRRATQQVTANFAAVKDMQVTVESVTVQANRVVLVFRDRCVIAATGKPYATRGVSVYEWRKSLLARVTYIVAPALEETAAG